MPYYEFRSDVGLTIERRFSFDEMPDEVVEDDVTYRRVISAPHVHYNAPGFTSYERAREDPVVQWQRDELSKF